MAFKVAAATTDKPQEKGQTKTLDSPGFGAYGGAATALPDLTLAVDKMPESKIRGSLDFTDSDKRWLKDLGITTTDPNQFHKVWEPEQERYNSKHRTWANTYGGRIGMRAISRGIVGAAFYAAGNMYSTRQMRTYAPEKEAENFLQLVAKVIDKTAGNAIESTAKLFTDEEKAHNLVTFRKTVRYKGYGEERGRSLGHEVMGVTFDFASMSFGDYMTRYALGVIDPNAKKHWIKNGHIDVPGGLKDLFGNVFRGITYASGEDMAVAIPYVFGMRLQRHIIDKASPGFRYDFDNSLNGGSFKVKNGKVVGDYQLEGMVDLMGRFSWYNVGTKMFRDAYSDVQERVEHFQDRWKHGDHSLPHLTPDPKSLTPSGIAHGVAKAARYLVRTTSKVMAYMLPATFAFYAIRSPQSKVRGIAIEEQYGVLGRDVSEVCHSMHSKGTRVTYDAETGQEGGFDESGGTFKAFKPGSRHADDFYEQFPDGSYRQKDPKELKMYYRDDHGRRHYTDEYPFFEHRTDAFKKKLYQGEKGAPWYAYPTDPIGRFSHEMGTVIGKGLNKMGLASFSLKAQSKDAAALEELIAKRADKIEDFSRIFANASLAYTPYFMAKTDILSAEWDTKRTDMALDRTIDGAVHLNWGEFKAGTGEVLRAMMREPFTDPKREEMAQRMRWHSDPEHLSNEAYQLNGSEHMHNHTTYSGRIQNERFADEKLKSKKITPDTLTQLKPAGTSWVQQEAIRQFQETNPQGQSVH